MTPTNSPKILFIDDEPLYAKAYGDSLTAQGYQVTTAKNGEDALEKMIKSNFDILIVDLIMPIMSGISFLKKVHRKKIPTIVFTTLEGETDREDAIKYGAKVFLKKGETSTDQLAETVAKLLNS